MRKILVVFNGINYCQHVVDYAIALAKPVDGFLVGAFLTPVQPQPVTYPFVNDMDLATTPLFEWEGMEEDIEMMRENMKKFQADCDQQGVQRKVHYERGLPLDELLEESKFADLIIIDAGADVTGFLRETLSASLKDLLEDAYCPVLVVPEGVKQMDQAILTYDGSSSAIYAIKMFSYLLNYKLKDLPVHVLSVNEASSNHLKEGQKAKELLHKHFTNLSVEILHGKPKEAISTYIKAHSENAVVVMGAYGRSALSRLFHQSMADDILRNYQVAVFIAHR